MRAFILSSFQSCWKPKTLSKLLTTLSLSVRFYFSSYLKFSFLWPAPCEDVLNKASLKLLSNLLLRVVSKELVCLSESRPYFYCGSPNHMKHERFLLWSPRGTGVHFTYRWQWSIDARAAARWLSPLPPRLRVPPPRRDLLLLFSPAGECHSQTVMLRPKGFFIKRVCLNRLKIKRRLLFPHPGSSMCVQLWVTNHKRVSFTV